MLICTTVNISLLFYQINRSSEPHWVSSTWWRKNHVGVYVQLHLLKSSRLLKWTFCAESTLLKSLDVVETSWDEKLEVRAHGLHNSTFSSGSETSCVLLSLLFLFPHKTFSLSLLFSEPVFPKGCYTQGPTSRQQTKTTLFHVIIAVIQEIYQHKTNTVCLFLIYFTVWTLNYFINN